MDKITLDADGATLVQEDKRLDANGHMVIRQKFDNGFTWIRTETPSGVKNIDFSHEMFILPNNVYRPDLNNIKSDFSDYY